MSGYAIKPKYIRMNEAAWLYSTSRSSLNRALDAGLLTRFKRGSSVLLEVEELERWVRAGAERADAS